MGSGSSQPSTRRSLADVWEERIIVVSALTAAIQMAWGLLAPILPAFAGQLGISNGEIGLLVASFGVGRVAANIPSGLVGRYCNRYWLFASGALGVVASTAASGFATSFPELLILRLLGGVAGGLTITTGQSLLADTTTDANRARTMSVLQAFQLTGGSVGPALGAFVASHWGLRSPFYVSGLVSLAIVIWLLARPRLRQELTSVHRQVLTPSSDRPSHGRSFAAVCVVGFATFYSRFGVQQTLLPLLAYQVVGLSVSNLGYALSAVAVLNIVCVFLLAGLADSHGRKRVIVGSLAGMAVATAAWRLELGTAFFLVMLAVFGLSSSIGGGTPAAYLADVVQGPRRSAAIGIYRTCGDLAGIVGPIVVGFAVEASLTVAIACSVLVNLGAAAIFAFTAHETMPPK